MSIADLVRHLARAVAVALLLIACANTAFAQARPLDLASLSLEELLNIKVTSASKRAQRIVDIAAATYVITQDDIQQSGLRNLPELLRLAPGVQVAQIGSNKWAISVRGFNSLFSDKLLVLVDGRSVYNQTSPGVFWESEDLIVDDIERIEIIRGPAGAMWGANAVNGLINIVSKSATETKGWLIRSGGGTFDRGQLLARYGGVLGQAEYRVSSQWTAHGASQMSRGIRASDDWDSWTNGLRVDWAKNSQSLMADANVVIGNQTGALFEQSGNLATSGNTDTANGHGLAQWKLSLPGGSSLQVQSFASFLRQDAPDIRQRQDIFDVDVQYHVSLAGRHELVAGGGYRQSSGNIEFANVSLPPLAIVRNIVNVFAQDDISVGKRVTVTFGARLEHDGNVGWGIQPTVRGIWTPKANHRLWLAASQALRTPSLSEARSSTAPGAEVAVGAERLRDAEIGYRFTIASQATIDVTAFRGRHDNLYALPTFDPSSSMGPTLSGGTLCGADTNGIEVAGEYRPTDAWKLAGSYSGLRVTRPATIPGGFDGNAPTHQWQLRSSVRIASRLDASVMLFHVGPLHELEVPAYTRVDTHLDFKIARQVSLRLTGQNLLSGAHREFAVEGPGPVATWLPRSAHVQLAWQF